MIDLLPTQLEFVLRRLIQTARLMVGIPDYETYVRNCTRNHPGKPIMSYEAFFRDRLTARYPVGKGRFRGCC